MNFSEAVEHEYPEISYKEEFKNIYEGMKGSNLNIRYMNKLATEENLIDVFKYQAKGLHFSGHGF